MSGLVSFLFEVLKAFNTFRVELAKIAFFVLVENAHITYTVLLGLIAVYLLLPKVRERPALPSWLAFLEPGLRGFFGFLDKRRLIIGPIAGVMALALAGGTILSGQGLLIENILFYLFSGAAIIGGVLLITTQNPARAAVSFVLVVISSCGLFLLLGAPFLMAGTAIIYAGAIVVTFLFVLMLAQQEGPSDADQRSREPLLACCAGFVLLGGLLYLIQATFGTGDLDRILNQTGRFETRLAELSKQAEADSPPSDEVVRETLKVIAEADPVLKALGKWATSYSVAAADSTQPFVPREPAAASSDLLERVENAMSLLSVYKNKLSKDKPTEKDVREALTALKDGFGQLNEKALWARASMGQLTPDAKLSEMSGPSPSTPVNEVRHDDMGRPQLPAENVAYLGRSLFGDYLLPVGLAGILLLVATIGAIAIATRHGGRGT